MKTLLNRFTFLLLLYFPFSTCTGQSTRNLDASFFVCNELLGRPTDKSITVNIVPASGFQLSIEYGPDSVSLGWNTEIKNTAAGIPSVFELTDLQPDLEYYYRIRYKTAESGDFSSGPTRSFHTQRSKGDSFTFTIEADPHPYDKKGCHNLWDITFKNMLSDKPDFMMDLGDTFGDDHRPFTITSDDVKQLHLNNRAHFGVAGHSVPLIFCLGNHEGESGYYLLQTPPDNLGVYGTLWRKYYYPNPFPNDFYSGNEEAESFGMNLPGNYYAWEWGDALFVVLDAYRGYTSSAKPRNWEWTLGEKQYEWLKKTLETSTARFKFVFAHHILGESRGGKEVAGFFEWGGYNSTGNWEFDTMRPGWEMPIHQLMKKHGVNIFFRGHDHLFAKEDVDGIVYQEVPLPSDSTYQIGMLANADAYTSNQIDGSGYLRVTVSPDSAFVEYVGSYLPKDETGTRINHAVRFSYSVESQVTPTEDLRVVPDEFRLEQNYPNPFNPETTIKFSIPSYMNPDVETPHPAGAGQVGASLRTVILKIYDILGREIATLIDEDISPGNYSVAFNASGIPSGIYFYRLTAGKAVLTKKPF